MVVATSSFSSAGSGKQYTLVDSPKKLHWLFSVLGNQHEHVSYDCETNHPTSDSVPNISEDDVVIGGCSFSWAKDSAAYLPLYTGIDKNTYWKDLKVFNAVREKLSNFLTSDQEKDGQNLKFDVKWAWKVLGIRSRGFTFDTMLAHHLLDEEGKLTCRHSLKVMAEYYLDPNAKKFEHELQKALEYYDPRQRRYTSIPIDILYPYACGDADYTWQLRPIFEKQMEEQGLLDLFYDYVMPSQQTCMLAEIKGLLIDTARVDELDLFYQAKIKELEEKIYASIGHTVDLNSPQKVMDVLYNELKLPAQKGKGGNLTSAADALETLKDHHPFVALMIEHRSVIKLHGSYVVGTRTRYEKRTGRIHPSFLIHGTKTGRLSSEDPNVQNMPRPENGGVLIKSMFISSPGTKWIMADYSQIELRIAAHVSKEPVWIQAFKDGVDLHSLTAWEVFKLDCEKPMPGQTDYVKKLHSPVRTKAKATNFGLLYGQTMYGISQELGMTLPEAEEFLRKYYAGLPTLEKWTNDTHAFAIANGYVVNPLGRRRRLPDAQSYVPPQQHKPAGAPNCWAKKKERPPIIRQFFDGNDLRHNLNVIQDTSAMHSLVSQLRNRQYEKCLTCSHISSCLIEEERGFRNHLVSQANRQGPNAIIQSFASDLTQRAFTEVIIQAKNHGIPLCLAENDPPGIAPVLTIHDENSFETHEIYVEPAVRLIKDVMENIYPDLLVPLIAEPVVTDRWSNKGE